MWKIVIAGVEYGVSNPVIEDQLEPYKIWCKFELPNTNENRDLVAADVDVLVKVSDKTVFEGVLTDPDYKDDKIIVDCADKVLNQMDDKLFIGDYNETAANTILAAICATAGVIAGSCPSTQVSVRFQNATCAHAAITLSRMVNKDRWTTLGTTFNIGDRGSAKGAVNLALGHHKKSRSQVRDYIIYEGTDNDGVAIEGTAGLGTRKARFLSRTAKDVATLTLLAERKLAELNSETLSLPAAIDLIHYLEKDLSAGDTITLSDDQKVATGSARIVKATMRQDKVDVDLYRAEDDLRDQVAGDRIFSEELGVYPPEVNLDDPPGPPAAPQNLALSDEIKGIRLNWDANTEADLDRYIIYRGTEANPTAEYVRVDSNQFLDNNVEYGTTYYYRIKAIDRVGNLSDYSNEVSTTATKVQTADIADAAIVASLLRKGVQPFNSDIVFSPKTGTEETQVEWSSGTIKFADGETLAIDAGYTSVLSVGTIYYIYFTLESATLTVTTDYSLAIGDTHGLLAVVGRSATAGQQVLIQPFMSKGWNFQADVIAANAILTNHLSALCVTSAKITTDQIIGKDFRTAENVGEVGGPAGFRFTPSEIAGYSGGTTKQFYVLASDGKLYAASGAVILDSDGLSIKGEKIWLKDAVGNTRGVIYGTGDSLTIKSYTDDIIISQVGSGKKIYVDGADLLPSLNEAVNIGSATKRILTVFCKTLDVTDAVTPGAHEETHRAGQSDAIMGALHLDAIPTLPHTKVDFADQNLNKADDAIFNSVHGVGGVKAGVLAPSENNISMYFYDGDGYLTSHAGNLILTGVGGFVDFLSAMKMNGIEVLSLARVLQNVTANASIINAGTFGVDRIPNLPASKITSGTFDLARIPTMDDAHIPDVEDLSYGTAFAVAQIPNLPTSKITSGQFTLARMPRAASGVLKAKGVAVDPAYEALATGDIPNLDASKITTGTFALARIPTMDDAHIPDVEGLSYTNPFATGQIPDLDVAKITTGQFALARMPRAASGLFLEGNGVAADPIYNALAVGDIPTLTTAKLSDIPAGAWATIFSTTFPIATVLSDHDLTHHPLAIIPTMDDDHIPNLEGLSYGGAFAVEQIPNLDVAKITSGRFGMPRMPAGTDGYVLKAKGAGVSPAYEIAHAVYA